MNYSLLIDNRTSGRAFQDKPVPEETVSALREYHDRHCARLCPDITTELCIAGEGAKEKLESAAGYHDFLIGAPRYMVLLSEDREEKYLNAGFIMEDLILKLSELGCASCWLTFTDGEKIKAALDLKTEKKVAALAAFGLPEKARKRIHLNIFTMSNVEIKEKQRYFDPKKKISELVYLDRYGNRDDVEEQIGYYGDMLWEAFHAAANSPSYMNRQPYSFLLTADRVCLLAEKDEVTGPIDRDLNLGAVMLHFIAVAKESAGGLQWKACEAAELDLPEGVSAVAECEI